MELAVSETLLNDQGIYFPERAESNKENISFIHEIKLNVKIMPLQHVYPNCGKKSLYM
jgi:hypothetical protein